MSNRTPIQTLSLVAAAVILFVSVSSLSEDAGQPWLEDRNPTHIEWLAVHFQAYYGDHDIDTDGITVSYLLGPRSASEGVLRCVIQHLPTVSQEELNGKLATVEGLAKVHRATYPWFQVQVDLMVLEP